NCRLRLRVRSDQTAHQPGLPSGRYIKTTLAALFPWTALVATANARGVQLGTRRTRWPREGELACAGEFACPVHAVIVMSTASPPGEQCGLFRYHALRRSSTRKA